MPRNPIDYSKTIIYKIEHNVDKSLVYVGSTTNFIKRKSQHKDCCTNEKSSDYNYKVYKMMRANGGWNEFQMLEIKKYPCNDSNEARSEEERCRIELKANMNAYKAFGANTRKEYEEKYRKENADKIKEWKKQIYDCECGCKISISHKARHLKSRNHKSTSNI